MSNPDDNDYDEGVAENFKFGMNGLRVGDGPMMDLPGPGSVTAVVGANNVGKSTFLQQILRILQSQSLTHTDTPRVVTELGSPWRGTEADMKAWLLENTLVTETSGTTEVRRIGQAENLSSALSLRSTPTPQRLTGWFVDQQSPLNRSNVCSPVTRWDPASAPPHVPMHVLFVDKTKRRKVEEFAQRLFKLRLQFDGVSNSIGFRVGDPGVAEPRVNEMHMGYAQALYNLPQLDQQGDGIRSALGLIIPLITNEHAVALIDEPEAFLHPPQARIMGTEMGTLAKENESQIILATHDKNILQGLVESGAPIAIIHLARTDDTTTATPLDASEVTQLWEDVILRYSNVIEGLFHWAVIITENDRDSHFYHAAIDSVQALKSPSPPAHNLMFIGANGKTNMAKIVTRLRKLGVPTVSCPDLDILNDEQVLKKLVEAHQGDWAQIQAVYRKATNEFRATPNQPRVVDVQSRIDQILADTTEERLNEELSVAIKKAAALPSDTWKRLKDFGEFAFKADKRAAATLLDTLDSMGIVTVREGVLENFLKTANAPKGPEFLPVALAEGAHRTEPAAQHARKLLDAAGF